MQTLRASHKQSTTKITIPGSGPSHLTVMKKPDRAVLSASAFLFPSFQFWGKCEVIFSSGVISLAIQTLSYDTDGMCKSFYIEQINTCYNVFISCNPNLNHRVSSIDYDMLNCLEFSRYLATSSI